MIWWWSWWWDDDVDDDDNDNDDDNENDDDDDDDDEDDDVQSDFCLLDILLAFILYQFGRISLIISNWIVYFRRVNQSLDRIIMSITRTPSAVKHFYIFYSVTCYI